MRRSAKLIGLACAFLSCSAGTAIAARNCGEGGMGGTGQPAVTGQEQNTRPNPSPTGGIGGTGIIASAGVVGVVTGFGSICVNGWEIQYRTDTPVEVDGLPAAARDLELGQVVRVDAEQISPFEYRAARIAVLEALVGPVTQVDARRRMFWVMGQPVRLTRQAVVALSGDGMPAVKAGVRVSGLMNAQGEVLASRVEGASPKTAVYLMANVTQLDRRVVQLGWVRVELPAGAENVGLHLGQEVAVRGRWDGESIVADAYWIDPRLSFASKPKRLSVEGYLFECDVPGRYAVDGIELRLPPAVGELSQHLGRRLVAHGQLAGRVLDVEEVRPITEEPIADPDTGKRQSPNSRSSLPNAFEEQLYIKAPCGPRS